MAIRSVMLSEKCCSYIKGKNPELPHSVFWSIFLFAYSSEFIDVDTCKLAEAIGLELHEVTTAIDFFVQEGWFIEDEPAPDSIRAMEMRIEALNQFALNSASSGFSLSKKVSLNGDQSCTPGSK